jgi:phosphoribulokinase
LHADPQKQHADVVIQVLPTQLIPDDNEGKILRVRMIMKEGVPNFEPTYLFDEGSTISWVPCGRKLTCSYPGIKFAYGPDVYYDNEVRRITRRPKNAFSNSPRQIGNERSSLCILHC